MICTYANMVVLLTPETKQESDTLKDWADRGITLAAVSKVGTGVGTGLAISFLANEPEVVEPAVAPPAPIEPENFNKRR